jgi:hypothetical protein
MPNLDAMLDMYLAGARDTLNEVMGRLKQTSLPPGWVKQQEEEMLSKLVAMKMGVTSNLVLCVSIEGFRWSYKSGIDKPVSQVCFSYDEDIKYKVVAEKYGVRVLANGIQRPWEHEPYVYQEF